MAITTLEYANLAKDVYLQNEAVELQGWQNKTQDVLLEMAVSNSYFDTDPGVAVYQKGTEVVIAYDGWEGPTLEEFSAGILTLAGLDSAYYAKAYFFAKAAIDLLGEGTSVSFVGHSQGGAFAGLMAAHFNKPAVTFNAQSAAQALPETSQEQTYHLYQGQAYSVVGWAAAVAAASLLDILIVPDETITVPAGSSEPDLSQVESYRVKYDGAGAVNDQIGTVQEIDLGFDESLGFYFYHNMAFMRFIVAAGYDLQGPPHTEQFLIDRGQVLFCA